MTECQTYTMDMYYRVPLPVAQGTEQIIMMAPVEPAVDGKTAPIASASARITDQESNNSIQSPSQVWSMPCHWPMEFAALQRSCARPAPSNGWQSMDVSVSEVNRTADSTQCEPPMAPVNVCIADEESNSSIQPSSQICSTLYHCPMEFDSWQWRYDNPKPAPLNGWQSMDGLEKKLKRNTDVDSTENSGDAIQTEALASELLDQMHLGKDEKWKAVVKFGYFASASEMSSKAAQMSLDKACASDKALLASSLHGRVRELVKSKFGNYVIQKIVEVLPINQSSFILEALLGVAMEFACDMYGCRVFCRILEHFSPHHDVAHTLVSEILKNPDWLICSKFGSHVARHIVEFEWINQKKQIAQAISLGVMKYANHGLGSHVIEACLEHCSAEDQASILKAMLVAENTAPWLARGRYSRHVMRAVRKKTCVVAL